MKLKKEFRKKSRRAQLETMGRYISDIATNIIDTIMGEKAGRMDYLEEGSDMMQGVEISLPGGQTLPEMSP